MKTITPHLRLVLLTLLLLALASAIAAQVGSAHEGTLRATAYGWPVKPFDRPHPVRGSFGDPRTLFAGPPTRQTLLSGGGSFSFHFGIDVSAPDGTAVYPVESGVVQVVTHDWLRVDCGGGRSFEYWHVAASVHAGQRVTARATVLGRIIRSCDHVHLSERVNGVYVNPLQRGHLEPYADTTRPSVHSIAFVDSGGSELMPELLRGRVEAVTEVEDFPTLRVPGVWRDLPVTPALVQWRVVTAATRKVVVPKRAAYDVRRSLPTNADFWRVYERGTHQNMSVFGKHYSYMQPGLYRIRLMPGGFDTRTLHDGVYELQVTATDIRGNADLLSRRFCVHNSPGVVGC